MKPTINHQDFLCDDLFIYWRTHPSEKLNQYWDYYLLENEEQKDEFFLAVRAFDNLRMVHDHYLMDEEAVKKLLFQRIKASQRNTLRSYLRSAAAAVLLLGVITTLYIFSRQEDNLEHATAAIGKVMNDTTIQLLAGGTIIDISNNSTLNLSEKNNSAVIRDSSSEKEIALDRKKANRLIVPFGKRSTIILADGSKVTLNSGTEMDFPARFSKHSREIWVQGEIFIDIVHQSGTPFTIHTPNSQIIVYGTSFNVTSYADEQRESVVLVNGSVQVKSMNSSIRLKPNEMALIEKGVLKHKEVDVSAYISWKNGYLQLNKTPLNEVLQKIGRYYNVEFRYPHNLNLDERTCSGKLFLSDNMDDVLEAFSKLTFLTYETNKESIYIK